MLSWTIAVITLSSILSIAENTMPLNRLNMLMKQMYPNKRIDTDIHLLADQPGGGENRGPEWYPYETDTEISDISTDESKLSSISSSRSSSAKSEASSETTREKRWRTRSYRTCTPCPADMLKTHKNRAIKWICGRYQRAFRTFKSECMMRFRNCQDGTMFERVLQGRCPDKGNITVHGRTWFYDYKV